MTDLLLALRYSRYAVARIVGAQDAEDVLQSAALVAWRKRRQFRGDSKYETWFYQIAVRQALMHLRRQRSYGRGDYGMREIAVGIDFDMNAGPAKTPEELTIEREQNEQLYEAILALSPGYKRAALRTLREEKNGETVGLSMDKAARHKMREKLREILCR